jgi:hypothetical protein
MDGSNINIGLPCYISMDRSQRMVVRSGLVAMEGPELCCNKRG